MSDRSSPEVGAPHGLYTLGERRPVSRDLLAGHATTVAPRLLGLLLVRDEPEGPPTAVRLVETEAYRETDPASHSHPPERRRAGRAAVMFGPPGHAYVYFTYGMHHCVNVTCEPAGTGAAVLLRAGIVLSGHDRVRDRRGPRHRDRDLLAGPARLTRGMGIDRDLDGTDLLDPAAPLRLETDGVVADPAAVVVGPRVGVRHAADAHWRFHLGGIPEVSRYARHPRA